MYSSLPLNTHPKSGSGAVTMPSVARIEEESDNAVDDLRKAVCSTLSHSGALGKLMAEARANVFHALEESAVIEGGVAPPPPPLSDANLLINELIRDYLHYNGYTSALGVFLAESGQPNDPAIDRFFLRGELGLTESAGGADIPLLYGIVSALMARNKEIMQ
eukprot:261150_1